MEQVVLPKALVDEKRGKDLWIGVKEKHLDEGVAAAPCGGDAFAERQFVDAVEEDGLDGPAGGRRDGDLDGKTDEVGPVEIVNQLDRVGLGRLPVGNQAQPDGVKPGEPLVLSD